jgi:hypothetical protein
MSDADAKRLREERLRAKREAHTEVQQKTLRANPVVPVITKNLVLTIQLQASTVEELRELSYQLNDKQGDTYDGLIVFLIRFLQRS